MYRLSVLLLARSRNINNIETVDVYSRHHHQQQHDDHNGRRNRSSSRSAATEEEEETEETAYEEVAHKEYVEVGVEADMEATVGVSRICSAVSGVVKP